MIEARQALSAFAGLSEPTRLEILRHLIQQGPTGQAAGDIARVLSIAPSRLSFHLKTLSEAGLAVGTRAGKQVIYRAGFETLSALVAFLLEDCCGGADRLASCCAAGRGEDSV